MSPKASLEHRQALEVVAGDVLVGDADAAVQLDALLADEAHADWPSCTLACDSARRRCARRLAELEAGVVAHRAGQFELHLHVGDAVAQRLEAGDRHAELLARVHVVDGDRHQPVHQAHGLGAGRGDADVDRVLEHGRCRPA